MCNRQENRYFESDACSDVNPVHKTGFNDLTPNLIIQF